MGNNLFTSIDRMGSSLSFYRDRQTVLAGNIANIDTPGYRPMDLERVVSPGAPTGGVNSTAMSSGRGQATPPPAAPFTVRTIDASGTSPTQDGNAVVLERELAKIQSNRLRYETTAQLISSRMALLKYAMEK